MKLIIDIPEKVYQNAKEDMLCSSELIVNAIKNGVPQETVTEFADRCKECGSKYGKQLKHNSREIDDYENEIEDLHNRLDIAEYDKERLREEVTNLETQIKALEQEPKTGHCKDCKYYHTAWDGTETHYYTDYWCEWVEPNENDFCSLYEPKEEVSE